MNPVINKSDIWCNRPYLINLVLSHSFDSISKDGSICKKKTRKSLRIDQILHNLSAKVSV